MNMNEQPMEFASENRDYSTAAVRSFEEWVEKHGEPQERRSDNQPSLAVMQMRLALAKRES